MNSESIHWIEPAPVSVPAAIRDLVDGPPFLAKALVRRGILDATQLRGFLDPNQYTPSPSVELPDLAIAADRLERAIQSGELIGVWGDFDVDGQTATALLVQALRALGGQVAYYIPVRARDSHGVALPAFQKFLQTGINLVLTCDTGISAHDAVETAHAAHVDFIITDHHSLPERLPSAMAVVNPQRLPETHPLFPLCGVGVAYKLAEELFIRAGRSEEAAGLKDLVALGTVSDLASLTGDNRYLVQRGLERMRSSPRPALEALYETAEIDFTQLSEEQISFVLAPRMNALGRLDDANPAVPFLLAGSVTEARPMASRLEALNSQRKQLCDQVFQAAQSQLDHDREPLDHPVLLLSHPAWPGGVLGIVASRLVELYMRPVILLATPPGERAHGSARSVEGVNIIRAIASAAPLLASYGGHPMAAGLSLDPARLGEFRRQVDDAVRQQQADHRPVIVDLVIDAFLPLHELTPDLVEALERLAPFGPGNPPFVLATQDLRLQSQAPFGKNNEHLQLIVEDSTGASQRVVWWQGAGSPLPEGKFDLAYTVRANNYRGQRSIQVEWIGARPIPDTAPPVTTRAMRRITDLRGELDPEALLSSWLEKPGVLIFAEGDHSPKGNTVDRRHLSPADTLIIWSLPPGKNELQSLLKQVSPREVVWIGMNTGSDQVTPFLTRLVGLVRFAIKKRNGYTNLAELAVATAQREGTIQAGLSWLAARGHISWHFEDEGAVVISSGGVPDPSQTARWERDLTYLLQESAAFHAYCQKVELSLLLHASDPS